MRRVIAVMTVGLWLAMPSGSAAGMYDVYGCRLPAGQPISADGWTPYTVGANVTVSNDCARGGGLTAQLDSNASVLARHHGGLGLRRSNRHEHRELLALSLRDDGSCAG